MTSIYDSPTQEQERLEQSTSAKGVGPVRRHVTPIGDRIKHLHEPAALAENGQDRRSQLEVVDDNVILYRSPNFLVRTTARAFMRGKVDPLRKPTGRTMHLPRLMPQQEKRVAASETRMMPSLDSLTPLSNVEQLPVPAWVEATAVILCMLLSLVVHAFNMFNYPRYELDEGTYMSNAWAILHHHVTPYAYGYGHPPLGWVQIAIWVQLTGGFFTFGNALNTGRVLMLFYALGCSLLVYLIVRNMGGSRSAGLLAMVICSLSPLSVTYQRQIFLDNIGIFWFLLSLYLLLSSESRLHSITGAALAFGISILSKEIFLLFTPVMIYAVWLHATVFQRKFALIAFIYTVVALTSGFVLMAILKGELFPYSWHLPWDHHPHLSMLDTFIGQTQRGQNEGRFIDSWHTWFQADPLLMLASIACLVFNLVVGWWKRQHLLLALLGLSFWVLLIRDGVVLSFYIIPLIPLIAINTAVAVNTIMNWIGKRLRFDIVRAILVLSVIGTIVPYDVMSSGNIFTQHPTLAQVETIAWIRNNIPRNAFIVINSYLYMDLRQSGGQGVGDGATYPFAHVYFNVATDPELRTAILHDNWDRIDYIILDSEMQLNILQDPKTFKIIADALAPGHCIKRTEFRSGDVVITIYEVKHTIMSPTVLIPNVNGTNRT
jgi:hypothetical protein